MIIALLISLGAAYTYPTYDYFFNLVNTTKSWYYI